MRFTVVCEIIPEDMRVHVIEVRTINASRIVKSAAGVNSVGNAGEFLTENGYERDHDRRRTRCPALGTP